MENKGRVVGNVGVGRELAVAAPRPDLGSSGRLLESGRVPRRRPVCSLFRSVIVARVVVKDLQRAKAHPHSFPFSSPQHNGGCSERTPAPTASTLKNNNRSPAKR